MLKALLISCAIVGSAIGSITLSLCIVHFYPSDDSLNRLYAAVFFPVLMMCFLLCYSLSLLNWTSVFLRAWSWWIVPLALLELIQ